MLPLLALAGIGAATGLAKSELIDRPKEERERKLAAETQRYSYLTGNKAEPIHEADPMGNAMQFGMAGAGLGQNIEAHEANQQLRNKQINWFDRHPSAYPNSPNFGQDAPGVRSYTSWGSW